MNLRSAFLALVLPFFAATGCDMAPGDKTALSDSAAKAVVEKEWENDGLRAPMRGRYQLNHSNWDWDKGTTNEKTYKDLVALDKIGLVVLEPRPKPNWTPWEYTVRPTGEGEKFTHPKNPRDLFLSAGSFRITEVVKNEKREKGVEVYRVVMVKYDWNQTDLWKKYAAARGKKNDAKRKGIVLLRWNAFDGKWQVEGWDVANEKDEIETTHVTDVLGRR